MSDKPRKIRKAKLNFTSNYDIEIIRRKCTGVMTCMEHAGRTFDLDEDAVAIVLNPNGNSDPDILEGAKSCPFDAIILHDKTTGEQVWPIAE